VGDLVERLRTVKLLSQRNQMALQAEAADEIARLREALGVADAAIKEWFRYLHGGEMRGSYDGKPEREQLRKAGYVTTAALQHKEPQG